MISKQDIERKLITIIAKSLQIPEKTVQMNSRLLIDLEAESIDILDIRFAAEQEFGIKFDTEEIRKMLLQAAQENQLSEKDIPQFFTVERFYDYIVRKIEQHNA
ncbi:MAG: hypothetical protein IT269_01935 [Saprospiraceae bacterium]|nr:hypothetical protein [Saprospiraceae bacterium]